MPCNYIHEEKTRSLFSFFHARRSISALQYRSSVSLTFAQNLWSKCLRSCSGEFGAEKPEIKDRAEKATDDSGRPAPEVILERMYVCIIVTRLLLVT